MPRKKPRPPRLSIQSVRTFVKRHVVGIVIGTIVAVGVDRIIWQMHAGVMVERIALFVLWSGIVWAEDVLRERYQSAAAATADAARAPSGESDDAAATAEGTLTK